MKRFALALAAGALLPMSVSADPLAVGAAAPAPEASDQDGKPVDLAEHYKSGSTLFFFYPKANTGG